MHLKMKPQLEQSSCRMDILLHTNQRSLTLISEITLFTIRKCVQSCMQLIVGDLSSLDDTSKSTLIIDHLCISRHNLTSTNGNFNEWNAQQTMTARSYTNLER